jgi:pimeloyl-ACP methyl ester carboxylesterase
MPRRAAAITPLVLLAILTMLPAGCAPEAALDPDQAVELLSGVALRPDWSCERLRAYYRVDYLPCVDNPGEIGLPYEETWVPVTPDLAVRLWYLPTELDRGTVILSNGNGASSPAYLFAARLLTRNGWSVVMYDYEGFGLSDGQPSITTIVRDLPAVLDWTRARTGRTRVTLMGVSLGSIPSIAVAATRPEAVNGLVLDSPVALEAQISRFDFLIGGRGAWLSDQLDPRLLTDRMIAQVRQPVLIFLHGRDTIATPATVQMLFNRAAGPKTLVRFPELDHARGQFQRTNEYVRRIEEFLTGIWSEE